MRARGLLFILPFVCTVPTLARADYRVFELVIRQANGSERTEISNLNPTEYRHYYPVPLTASIGYRATWRCLGNTSWFTAFCPNPFAVPTTSR